MRMLSSALLFSLAPLLIVTAFAAAPAVAQFDSEEKAKIRCPLDKIVWINPRKHLWYPRTSKHYANDGVGGFACFADVKAAGVPEGKG